MLGILSAVALSASLVFSPTVQEPKTILISPEAQQAAPPQIGEIVIHEAVQYVETVVMQETVDYVTAVEHQNVVDYVSAVQNAEWTEAQHALGRYLGSRNAPAATPHYAAPSPSSEGGGSTGACGGATNGADAFISRESGGNPGISNGGGSGAYGCYQIMPSTWSSSCSDLGAEMGSSPSTQAQCASRLPLSAWASSGPT